MSKEKDKEEEEAWEVRRSRRAVGGWGDGGVSLGQQLLEEALLLGLVVLGALRHGALLGRCRSNRTLVQVGLTADQVHRALDVGKHLNLLHLRNKSTTIINMLMFLSNTTRLNLVRSSHDFGFN